MGNCVITIRVTGTHHNGARSDIDQMAGDFVDHLKAKGHSVADATITSGGTQDLAHKESRFPLREDNPKFYGG